MKKIFVLLSVLFLFHFLVQAQEVERLTVIGSRIKRLAKENSRQEIKVSKEDMKNSANATLSETLRDLSAAMSGTLHGTEFVLSTVGLNGMDASKTLVLLNGHRFPVDPSFDAVDLNAIPQSAIERIEILKDGASAIYGSDAIGGVINIVTKKGVRETDFNFKYSTPEKKGGSAAVISATTGYGDDKHDLTVSASYIEQAILNARDRESTRDGLQSIGPAASWSGVGQPTSVLSNPSDCDPSLIVTDSSGQHCYYKFNDIATAKPGLKQFNILTDYTFRTGSGYKVYNRNTATYREVAYHRAPDGYYFGPSGDPSIPDDLPSGTLSNPNARTVQVVFAELGQQDITEKEVSFNALIGFNKSLTSSLELDVSSSYGEVNQINRTYTGGVNAAVIKTLVQNGTIDPLAPVGSRGDFSAARIEPLYEYRRRLFSFDALLSGDLVDLSHGPLGFASGISVLADSKRASGDDIGFGVYDARGSREIYSAFTEFSYNVLKDLEIDAALRFDGYSDFGQTLNPKLSAKYTVSDQVLIRSAVGTSFKAPRFSQLYQTTNQFNQAFIDRKLCQTDPTQCAVGYWKTTFSGNRDLKEEKAFTASLGTVIQPTQNFSFSVDGWYNKITNVVDISLEAVTQAEVNGVNPSDYGVTVSRDPGTGQILMVTYKSLNLTNEELAGLDVNVQNIFPQTVGHFDVFIQDNYSYIVFDKYEGFPGAGQRNLMGEWGKPYWRNKIEFGIKDDLQEFKITMRSIPGANVSDRYIDRKISDLNEWDLDYARAFGKKITASLGIKNIMDAAQPLDTGGGIGGSNVVNQALYDISGRQFFMSYSQKF